ncbi:MAG: RNA polymerase sigma factor [Bacteroidota bacterium]
MSKVKAGELEKLGLLYERYKKRLFGFFYQMNLDAELSEDLVQNVFVRVLKYRHSYIDEGQFITWLFKIARNVNYDHFRKSDKLRQVELSRAKNIQLNVKTAEEQITTMEYNDLLQKAMTQLSMDQREVLILSKFKELKYKEIGEVLNCSEANARIKAHRALTALRTIFLEMDK